MTKEIVTKIGKSSIGYFDQKKEEQWLKENSCKYKGEWVVLDGSRLVGHGSDPRPIVAKARSEGVITPFVEFIRDETEPFTGAWL